jgi:hypothetical protein
MNPRAIVSMILAWAIPGAGHVYLGRRGRALAFFLIVAFMFVVGVCVDGGLYTPANSGGALLRLIASYGSMGSGLMYFAAMRLGVSGDATSSTFEYGSTFTLTAGIMNLLLVLDCFDVARGVKR